MGGGGGGGGGKKKEKSDGEQIHLSFSWFFQSPGIAHLQKRYRFSPFIILCFSDCHDSTCAFLIVMLILIYALFYSTSDHFCV